MYVVNEGFHINPGFEVTANNIYNAVVNTNHGIKSIPQTAFINIDFKTTSAIIGAYFCNAIANECNEAIVNPIEKGHPDIIPRVGGNASEEELRNYGSGLEIKCTIGNVNSGSNLRAGQARINSLTSIAWQAHHRDVRELMGVVWDFFPNQEDDDGFLYPTITGVFYSDDLSEDDWGAISGTTGRNTKVCGMKASGKSKMGEGWVLVIDNQPYISKYNRIFNINI